MFIEQSNFKEEEKPTRQLEKKTFAIRFRRLLQRLKTTEISIDDITREVEISRQNRNEKSK
jgi:hypothetical protein